MQSLHDVFEVVALQTLKDAPQPRRAGWCFTLNES